MDEYRSEFVEDYINRIKRILDDMVNSDLKESVNDVVEVLLKARQEKRTVYIMGNGGSGSTASHFVSDLSKKMKATAQGTYQSIIGIINIPAGLIAGLLWDISYKTMFTYIAVIALISVILLIFVKE